MINISPTREDYSHILSPVQSNNITCQQSQQNLQFQQYNQNLPIQWQQASIYQQPNIPISQLTLPFNSHQSRDTFIGNCPSVHTSNNDAANAVTSFNQQQNIPIGQLTLPFNSLQSRDIFYGNCSSVHTSNNNNDKKNKKTKESSQVKKTVIIPEPPFQIGTLSTEINNAMKGNGSRISQSAVVKMIDSLQFFIRNSSDGNDRNIRIISSLVLSIILGSFKYVKYSTENNLKGTPKEIYMESIKQIFSIEESIDYASMNFHEFINLLQEKLLYGINNESLVSSFLSESNGSELNSQISSSSSSNINYICHNMISTDINKVKYSNENLLRLLTEKDIRIQELLNMNEQLRSQINPTEIGSTISNHRKRSNSTIDKLSTMKIVNINSSILTSAIPKINISEIHFILFTMHYFITKGIFLIPKSNMKFTSFLDCIADSIEDSDANMVKGKILQYYDARMKDDESNFIYETTHKSEGHKVKPPNYDTTRDYVFVNYIRNCVEQNSMDSDMIISRLIPMISTIFNVDFILYKYEYNLHFSVLGNFDSFNEESHDFTNNKSRMIVQYKDNDTTVYRIFDAMENLLEEFDTILSKQRNFF